MTRIRGWARGSIWRGGLLVIAGLLVVIQLVPYGRDHTNPPITKAVAFDSPRTEQLVDDACSDCHSNLTSWPIESSIAPTSWLIQRDVEDGREALNFSEWDRPQTELGEVDEVVSGGEMPPLQYRLLHPSARLSDSEKADLVDGLTKTWEQDPPGSP